MSLEASYAESIELNSAAHVGSIGVVQTKSPRTWHRRRWQARDARTVVERLEVKRRPKRASFEARDHAIVSAQML